MKDGENAIDGTSEIKIEESIDILNDNEVATFALTKMKRKIESCDIEQFLKNNKVDLKSLKNGQNSVILIPVSK